MTKQEEIRDGVEYAIMTNRPYLAKEIAGKVIDYLHSQGVVIKVGDEEILRDIFVPIIEPLIEEGK